MLTHLLYLQRAYGMPPRGYTGMGNNAAHAQQFICRSKTWAITRFRET